MAESVENKNLETMQNGPKQNECEQPDFIVHNKFRNSDRSSLCERTFGNVHKKKIQRRNFVVPGPVEFMMATDHCFHIEYLFDTCEHSQNNKRM